MAKKLEALDGSDLAADNTRSRFIAIKEQQAEIAKHELNVLWTDYFKPNHLEQHPQLWEIVLERRAPVLTDEARGQRRRVRAAARPHQGDPRDLLGLEGSQRRPVLPRGVAERLERGRCNSALC